MDLKQFIGKIVISTSTKNRYRLHDITSPYIEVVSEKMNSNGYPSYYRFDCINGDPISNGTLSFENQSLTELFKKAYTAHCRSMDGYWEDYGYWMRRD
jgi:hypothetical protein